MNAILVKMGDILWKFQLKQFRIVKINYKHVSLVQLNKVLKNALGLQLNFKMATGEKVFSQRKFFTV